MRGLFKFCLCLALGFYFLCQCDWWPPVRVSLDWTQTSDKNCQSLFSITLDAIGITFCNSLCHLPPPCICWSLSVVSILYIDSLINFPGKCEPKKVLDTNFELNQCETQKKLSLIEENKSFGSIIKDLVNSCPYLPINYDCSSYFKLSSII